MSPAICCKSLSSVLSGDNLDTAKALEFEPLVFCFFFISSSPSSDGGGYPSPGFGKGKDARTHPKRRALSRKRWTWNLSFRVPIEVGGRFAGGYAASFCILYIYRSSPQWGKASGAGSFVGCMVFPSPMLTATGNAGDHFFFMLEVHMDSV